MAEADGDTGPDARPGRRWDVALSFAGAQRDYVGRVAAALKARGVRSPASGSSPADVAADRPRWSASDGR